MKMKMKINFLSIILIILIVILLFYYFNTIKEKFEYKLNEEEKKDKNISIPLNIYQTWHTKDLDTEMQKAVDIVKEKNPEFTHHLFDDHDCAKFIETHFDKEVLDAYNTLIPGAYKADLWRYCILYINGGIYMDIKYFNVADFKLINLTDKEYFVRDIDRSGRGIYNAFMVCYPGNPKLLNAINNIVQNVKNRFYGGGALDPTGPILLKREFSEEELNNIRLTIGENDCPTKTCINLDGKPILAIYKDYYKTRQTPKKSYHDYWYEKNIYL